jgi:hypothetical protein
MKTCLKGYGVTLWEIFSYADVPFPNYTWTDQFTNLLKIGKRLEKPQNCPDCMLAFVFIKKIIA